MKNLLKFSLLFLFLMQSCSKEAWLSGTIDLEGGEDWKPMVYLVVPEKFDAVAQSFVGKVLDSAQIDESGSFEFTNPPEMKAPVLLEIVVQRSGEKYANKLLNENPETDNYFPLVYESEKSIKVNAKISQFQASFSLEEPSLINGKMIELRDLRLKAYQKQLKNQSIEEASDEGLLEREKRLVEYQKQLMDFADDTDEFFPAMVALRWASPEGNYERIAELLYDQSEKWRKLYPEHPWTKELGSMADKENLPILIGDQVPDLLLPMENGREVRLQSLIENQRLVLLDVWASWCAPCRMENRKVLLPLWEKYNAAGFQIVAYGLESSEKAWNNAVKKDGAYRWLHASHLLGDQNPLMDAFRLKTIPANFLLNEEGRVLAKNLHGEDLIEFVDNYMKER
ncbi:redoxin domain-containing protein [Muricauda sp. HICW]|uniref:Redoxin domain-containing protein n=1 Tax=Flagellimonas chongwuensis TaxID=2697365 RepID=A0A850NHH2_9FLAO|nr:TlpA disulfide reductase family protein [Allomuricauda chongwuensis]NVN18390.1 redoxin domain-containing protein [Allomuricauda chongwuensis]